MVRRTFAALVLTILLCSTAFGATKIDIVDYDNSALLFSDGTYFYYQANSAVGRKNVADRSAATNGKDFGGTLAIHRGWAGQSAGEVYFTVRDSATDLYYLYRSIDYGANVGDNAAADDGDPVLLLGDDGGSQTTGVALLSRGFTWDATNSQYLVGEYNAHASGDRTAGGANDRVRLMKSADGITWTEVATWNNDGSNNNITHIHSVQYSPYSEKTYICFGDGATKSGIMEWDGTSEITSNQDLSAYSDATILQGAETYRGVDLIFTPTHIVWFADNHNGNTTSGIFRSPYSMVETDVERVYEGTYTSTRDGFYGIRTTAGIIILTEMVVDSTADTQMGIYTSDDGGATFERAAVFGCRKSTATGAFYNVYQQGDYIYFPFAAFGAGKFDYDTVVVSEQGRFAESRPVIIHPVHWVAAGGTNAVSEANLNGMKPSAPWLTLEYALESDRITYGARVIVAAGTFSENYIDVDWNGHATEALETTLTVIEGQGRDATIVNCTANAALLNDFKDYNLLVKNITLSNTNSGTSAKMLTMGTLETNVYFEDAAITGPSSTSTTGFIRSYFGNVYLKRTYFSTNATPFLYLTPGDGQSAIVDAEFSVFSGGAGRHILATPGHANGTAEVKVKNSVFYNYATNAVEMGSTSGTTNVPTILNNIFYGGTGSTAYVDLAGLTETDAKVNYNVFYNTTVAANLASGVCDGTGDGCKTNHNPLFVNAAGGDFRILGGSPAKDAGSDLCSTYVTAKDYAGNPVCAGSTFMGRGAGMNVGAMENSTGGLFNTTNRFNQFAPHRRLH